MGALIVLIETGNVVKLEDIECRAFGNERDRRAQGGAVARGPPQAARDAQDANRLMSLIIVASAAKNLRSFALPAQGFVAHSPVSSSRETSGAVPPSQAA